MMFTTAEWQPIIEQLYKLTKADRVDWEVEPIAPQVFIAWVKSAQYEVGSVDDDGQRPYYLAVGDGVDELDRIESNAPQLDYTEATLSLVSLFPNSSNPAGAAIAGIYNMAKRKANNAEAKAATLLDELLAVDDED